MCFASEHLKFNMYHTCGTTKGIEAYILQGNMIMELIKGLGMHNCKALKICTWKVHVKGLTY